MRFGGSAPVSSGSLGGHGDTGALRTDDSSHHSGHQIHPPQQVLEARVVAEGVVTTEKAVAGLVGQS